ncbi:hypothetical protein [Saccharothrix coeruleofusca]|uniref:Uncharacterized protein n=1 Tax=Saccharothrix coeruleofusca TaxID=33919 RepID=A0A918AR69_9PSEU|nr:hypothetical protein [Saccharothrix coeruleofusca]GGP64779.1 hypothetical protein GCM10010185_41690 [Saccharothrix coeruleofusca]
MNPAEVRVRLADAATALAGRVLDALRGAGAVGLVDYMDACPDEATALGAVRLLGADLFAPQLVADRLLDAREAAVVAESFGTYPPVIGASSEEQRVAAWRDWAAVRLLALFYGPEPDAAGVAPPDNAAAVLGRVEQWPLWSAAVARLSPLALPEVGGPVVAAVVAEPLALTRGASRAVLRRDYPTAARLARWTALLAHLGVELPLDPAPLVEHVRLRVGAEPRLLLDLAVARLLLGSEAV